MFCDFPTLQAIKQVAKCPVGSGPGLVRGRFLSCCGREREEDRAALILQGHGSRWGLASGTEWAQALGARLEPGLTQPWLVPLAPAPHSVSSTAVIQAQGNYQPQPVLWRAWHQ